MRTRPQRYFLASILILATGCSSSSSSSTSGDGGSGGGQTGFTGDQLCALVTQADMSAALGVSVGPGVPSGVNAPSCSWQSPDHPIGSTIAAAGLSDVGQIPYGLQGNAGAHITDIPNLGDGADFAAGSEPAPTAELDMKKGSRAVTITMNDATDGSFTQDQQEAAELAIAKAAVKNM